MATWKMRCSRCSKDAADALPDYCKACGAPREVYLDYGELSVGSIFNGRVTDLWKYVSLYPLDRKPEHLTLGEGGTALIQARQIGEELKIPELWWKLDHLNPSGSFKDRGVSVGMAHAVEAGAQAVVCASSGNAAGSVAMYAARARLPAIILIPAAAPAPKMAVATAHGATVLRVDGDFSRAFHLARQAAQELAWHNLSTTYVNGIVVEGNKSVAYELYEQLGEAPDWIVIPVSAGPLLYGVWKGFTELAQFGLVDKIPRLVAVQPEGCAPIAQAFATGTDEVNRWSRVETIVSGLNDSLRGYEQDGQITLHAVRSSNGLALAIPDERILQAGQQLAQKEGIFVEPAAATAVAGVKALQQAGHILRSERVVCLLTGHGLKQPIFKRQEEPPVVGNIQQVRAAVKVRWSHPSASADISLHKK